MVQTNVEDECLEVVSKTIFADAPPTGRGIRTQDHLEMSTVFMSCNTICSSGTRICEYRVQTIFWSNTGDENPGKRTHPAREGPSLSGGVVRGSYGASDSWRWMGS
ncbi:hypothetical protein OG21DRAFT_1503066 [Imleria badia]|nr:hypothetical protein OG21DRAFT_1503066 [Imleria badia]